MKKLLIIMLFVATCAVASFGQVVNTFPALQHFPGAPTNPCSSTFLAQNDATDAFFTCDVNTLNWVAIGAGISCSPIVNNSVLYLNSSGSCVPTTAFTFTTVTNTLTAGANGQASVGVLKANGTGAVGATFTTNTAGTQALVGAQFSGSPLTIEGDSSTTPINFIKLSSNSTTSFGIEISGHGDIQGSGSAAGLKIVNPTSTINTSPGASNSITAGNSQGTTSSPGGSNTITAGNSSGTGAGSSGGSNTITAGSASGGNNIGGDNALTAGAGTGTGRGGNINLNPGAGTPNGSVVIGAGSGLLLNSVTFATLPVSANGAVVYCSDCNATCAAGAGTGRTCFRENGVWVH